MGRTSTAIKPFPTYMIKVMFPKKIDEHSSIRTPDFINSGEDNVPLARHPIMNAIRKVVNAIRKKKTQVQFMNSYRKFVLDPKACISITA
jgi:hypothetical protein